VGAHVITFPRSGVFLMHLAGESFVADPNGVIFSNRDDVFRTSHPGARGDDTVWLAADTGIIEGALSRFDPAAADRPGHLFPFTHGPCEPRTFLLHQAVLRHSAGTAPDHVLITEEVCALVDQAVASAYSMRGVRPLPARARTDAAHRDIAEGVKRVLAMRFAERLTIDQIADQVQSSPFHVCRVFRRHAGLPIHRYLNRLRLRAAVERLLSSECNLADLAAQVGFASHSHFSDAFRREFGTPPSTVRDALGRHTT
jgi:AraC family transcriptional regulator